MCGSFDSRKFGRGTFVALWALLAGACGDSGQNDATGPVGTVIAEQTLDIGEVDQVVVLRRGSRIDFPAGVVAQRTPITVRLSEDVMKPGPQPVAPVVQIATRGLTFMVPARMRQEVMPPPVGKRYMAVTVSDDGDDLWVVKTPARVGPQMDDAFECEIDVLGSGLWAIALVDDDPADALPAMIPQIQALAPLEGDPGTSVQLTVFGTDLSDEWSIYFDGTPYPTTVVGDTHAVATIPVDATGVTGSIAVWLGVPNQPALRSNILYFYITAAAGAPLVLGYSPDNGLPGDTVVIVGYRLSDDAVTITDANGNPIAAGLTSPTGWIGATVESVAFVIPANMATGPITVSNSMGSYRGKVFNVGQNLSQLPVTEATASSQYNTTNWSIASGWDNDLRTSWFSALGDCATNMSCTSVPWFQLNFSTPQLVARIAMRGNREYSSGYDFLSGTFSILDGDDQVLWSAHYALPEPDRDLDIVLPAVPGARAVRFSSTADESIEPGFSELQVFGP